MARATTMTKIRTVQHDTISVPVLTYTDALPRDDLRDINPSERQINHAKQWAFPPTRVADKESKESCSSAKFDFQLTAPPDEPTPTTATSIRSPVGSHTIGIALGSPGLMGSPEALPPPRFNTGVFNEGSEQPRKSSKWKKIGGLFRAKNALTSPTTTRPTPSKDMEPKEKPNTNKATRKEDGSEEWPKIEVEPIVGNDTSPKRSRKFSMSGRKDSKDKGICSPMLDVNIPDVQMERYSVMFSNVMNKNHKPSLLARRSKTLDNLRVPSAQGFLTAKVPPVPQRRATSPAHTRSSFTLFPAAQPSRAQVVGTQNFSRGPSPLLRSNTLPVSPKASPSPRDLPRPLNNNSLSSFESPVIPKLFSGGSNTPVSASSYRREDKPLPAIKPEPPVARSRTVSPQVQVPQPRRTQSDRNMKSVHQVVQPERSATEPTRPIKPTLKVQTELRGPPLPAKDRVTPKSASALSAKMTTREHVNRIMSPAIVQSPMEIKSAPAKEIKAFPVKASKPVVTEREISSPVSQPRKKVSKIEVSTARSISVSKGKRQILVPIGARMEQLNPNERLVEQRAMTPTIMDVQFGHRHGASQELQIESI